MPGGRLTQQERQQIALGLADGLAYAEIARRLDRPTSTITREVMRNGGPTAYRADLAHRATERRAHRRRQAAAPGPEAPPQAHGRDAEAVREYEETFTTVLMAIGPAQDDVPGAGLPLHHRRGQPHRVRTRPAPPGQPGVHLQGDRVPREPGPRPPGTRRTPPRALRRRRRRLVPVDDRQRPRPTPSSSRPHGRASASSAPTPRPPPAWRTSPASSTSSARASPAPRNRPARSSTRNPKRPQTAPPAKFRSRIDSRLDDHSHDGAAASALLGERSAAVQVRGNGNSVQVLADIGSGREVLLLR